MKKRYIFTKGHRRCGTCNKKYKNSKSSIYIKYRRKMDCMTCTAKEIDTLIKTFLERV